MNEAFVSILTLAYNQEKTILRTIKSVLSQKVEFRVELIILDDCSTDMTEEIVQSISSNSQIELKYFKNKENLGPSLNGVKGLNICSAKYIAFCEGDDYWIDENKLQKQVDFLESNNQYGGVSTNNRWYFENTNRFKDSVMEAGPITFEDLCKGNRINSQTILFRKDLIKDLDWMNALKIGDWALHLLVTSQKPYYRLADITTVYRVHDGGVHSVLKEEIKVRYRIEVLIAVLKNVPLSLERKTLLKRSIRALLKQLISHNSQDQKTTRKMYFEYGGGLLNKTILKSYIHEIF